MAQGLPQELVLVQFYLELERAGHNKRSRKKNCSPQIDTAPYCPIYKNMARAEQWSSAAHDMVSLH